MRQSVKRKREKPPRRPATVCSSREGSRGTRHCGAWWLAVAYCEGYYGGVKRGFVGGAENRIAARVFFCGHALFSSLPRGASVAAVARVRRGAVDGRLSASRGYRRDERVKNRVRLWLRSERAMGLSAVPVRARPPRPLRATRKRPPRSIVRVPRVRAQLAMPKATAAPFSGQPSRRPPRPTADGRAVRGGVTAERDGPVRRPARAADRRSVDTPSLRRREAGATRQLDGNEVKGCTRCRRTNTVFGEGDPHARIFFSAKAPARTKTSRADRSSAVRASC